MPSSSILRDEAVLRRLPYGDMSSMIQKRFFEPVAVGMEMVLPERKEGSTLKNNQSIHKVKSTNYKQITLRDRLTFNSNVQPYSAKSGSQLSKHREPHSFLFLIPRMIKGGGK